jgi:hypothetical protein
MRLRDVHATNIPKLQNRDRLVYGSRSPRAVHIRPKAGRHILAWGMSFFDALRVFPKVLRHICGFVRNNIRCVWSGSRIVQVNDGSAKRQAHNFSSIV